MGKTLFPFSSSWLLTRHLSFSLFITTVEWKLTWVQFCEMNYQSWSLQFYNPDNSKFLVHFPCEEQKSTHSSSLFLLIYFLPIFISYKLSQITSQRDMEQFRQGTIQNFKCYNFFFPKWKSLQRLKTRLQFLQISHLYLYSIMLSFVYLSELFSCHLMALFSSSKKKNETCRGIFPSVTWLWSPALIRAAKS